MTETSYKIKYRKGDFEIELQGDKEWVEKKFKDFIEEKIVEPTAIVAKAKALPDSLVEFLKSKGDPKEHIDRIIIFSYWLFHKENQKSYNVSDIERCYDEARIAKPTNIHAFMNELQAKGFLKPTEEKDGKKAWVITRTGEEYVEKMRG
ncbi:MAG: hypothetical protein N3A69_15765 [Leptospiraceae bacterium]|nr:hypothetical protein [Leptospiraceae bacterium]